VDHRGRSFDASLSELLLQRAELSGRKPVRELARRLSDHGVEAGSQATAAA